MRVHSALKAEVGPVFQLLFLLRRHDPAALEKDLVLVVAAVYSVQQKQPILKEIRGSFHLSRYLCVRFPWRLIPGAQTLALQTQNTALCSLTPLGQRASCLTVVTDVVRTLHLNVQPSGVPRNFFRGGVQQIQLRTEDRENGDLGA